ncbi:hypothetical protein MNBD_PLANCTO02-3112 [hydrothermal vent metagenome]|uniref:Carboxymuconolactone decarboxylase-like domain-containing protein n=1 Tax=hydrothermal vent metagenome TaxID=652676 RepID=A0A3B1DRF9_9ZZZZ
MTYLPSLPANGALLDIFKMFPQSAIPLIDFHEVLLRGDSPFSKAERELIAAYVSGLNACSYCHGIHTVTAQQFGIPVNVMTELMEDVATSTIDDAMKPVLQYAKKLTETPERITKEDAQTIFSAGWNETALHNLVMVTSLFNCMNRIIFGLGVDVSSEYHEVSGKRLHEGGYAGLNEILQKEITKGE